MISIFVGNLPRLTLAAALLMGLFLFWRSGRQAGFSEEKLLDLALVTLLAALVGGKFYYAFFHSRMAAKNWPLLLRVWEGPYSFVGGLIFGAAAGIAFLRLKGWSVAKLADLAAVPLACSLFIFHFGLLWPWVGDFLLLGKAFLYFSLFLALVLTRDWFTYSGFTACFYLGAFSLLEFSFSFLQPSATTAKELIFSRLFYLALFGLSVLGWVKRQREVPGQLKMNLPKSFLDQLKRRLLREEKELEQQQIELEKEEPYLEPGRAEINPDAIEDAQEDIAQTRYAVVRDSVSKMRAQIQKALAKLHLGTYGRCERCGQTIDPARLKAFPAATLCLDCAEKEEEGKAEPEESSEEISL